jgi:RHS repeat-associated protein
VGTVYLRRAGEPDGVLILDQTYAGGDTPLGLPGIQHYRVEDRVLIKKRSDSNGVIRAEHPGMVLEFTKAVQVEAGRLSLEGSTVLLDSPLTVGDARGSVEVTGVLTASAPILIARGRLTTDGLVTPELCITNGGILTSWPSTATKMRKLEVDVAGVLAVSAGGKIDVNGKGYLAGRTTGNTTEGGATGSSGGSYGGWGAAKDGVSNAVYGDYRDPNDWGSGGGLAGHAGGGLIRLRARELKLAGSIEANCADVSESGGSGGGIRVDAEVLSGTGTIMAGGGVRAGRGGGGRIAVYVTDDSGFTGDIAGVYPWLGGGSGGVGTVYLRRAGEPDGVLILDQTYAGGDTPLGLPGIQHYRVEDRVLIKKRSGSNGVIRAEHPGLVLEFASDVRVEGGRLVLDQAKVNAPLLLGVGAYVQVTGALQSTIPQAIGAGNLEANRLIVPELWVTNGAVVNAPTLEVTGLLHVESGGRLSIDGTTSSLEGPLVIGKLGVLEAKGQLSLPIPLALDAGTVAVDRLVLPQLSLSHGATLTCPHSTINEMHKLEVEAAGSVAVDPTSTIHVSARGYAAGRTTGNTTNGAAMGNSGGSYGGLGHYGSLGMPPGMVYGDFADPNDWGSGSGSGGSGGGLLRLRAETLQLDGSIVADAGPGGSGGGVMIWVDRLSGAGAIRAGGGGGTGGAYAGAGGGGRIAVYALDYHEFPTNSISAPGGLGSFIGGDQVGGPGQPGTVWIVQGRPHTHVWTHVPLGRNNGYWSNAIERVTLFFNQPINRASLAPTSLQIRGPHGAIPVSNMAEINDRTFAFDFSRQTENATYTFWLPHTLLDAEGFMLDQNANGTPGEPDDDVSFRLIVDTVAPRIKQMSPSGDVAGTITNVDIWCSETVDKTTFTASDVVVRDPTDSVIPVRSVTEVGLNRFRIAFPAQTAAGQYRVTVGPNITDLAGNPLNQDGDAMSGEADEDVFRSSFNLVPVDLEVTSISPSGAQLWAGDIATVTWTGRNNSGAPLVGNWTDALYLSPDPFWNITDIRLATATHTGGMDVDQAYTASGSFSTPGLVPGSYFFIVRADLGNEARETVESNNIAVSAPIQILVRQLSVGSVFSGSFSAANRLHYFSVEVPSGTSLRLNLASQSGINHLFVNAASIPSRQDSDFSARQSSASQTLTLTGVPGGATYYVLVSGEQVSGGDYNLTAETASFFVNAINPSLLVAGESSRDWVSALRQTLPTAVITGDGLDGKTTVAFVGSQGQTYQPTSIYGQSSTTLPLFLDTRQWQADTYDVRVTKGGVSRSLTGALTVVTNGEAKLEARIIGTALSPFGGQTLYVEYANVGGRAMPAPLLKVTAYTFCTITTHRINWEAIPGYAPSRRTGSGGGGGGGTGSIGIPTYVFNVSIPLNSVQAMAVGSGVTPGWLQPGERGRVPVYFAGLYRDLGQEAVRFGVGSVTADDTTLVEWPEPTPGVPGQVHFPRHGRRHTLPRAYWTNGTERLFTVNWTALESKSRPETIAEDAWHAVWGNLSDAMGPLWPDYVMTLGDNMNHLAKIGQMTNDPGQLFNFEVLQASAALNPTRTLAGAVDASAPSPGFPLVFRRTYGQPIPSRYRIGPFGRGWSHNWDVYVQTLTNSYGVMVRGPNGADRFFGQLRDGTYTATANDTGALIVTDKVPRLVEKDGTVWHFSGPGRRLGYVEDPNGNRISCGYTGALLTSLTHTSGKQILLQYNGSGRLAQITDPLGPGASDDRITTYEYDGSGEHLIRVTAPGNRVTTYAYNLHGTAREMHALVRVVHPDLTEDGFAYDSQGRLIQTSQNCCGGAQQVTYTYDSAGTVTVTDATGRATQLLYGLGGQLAQVRDGEGRIVNFTYDDLAQLTQLLGPGGERYRYGYDGLGNLSGIEDPLRQINNFTYEPNFNRLAQVRDARGNDLKYAYDNRGNLTAITYANATAEQFGYDARGNVVTSTNRRGGVITYTYNAAGQLTSKDYATTPGLTDFTYAYDSAGNLRWATYFDDLLGAEQRIEMEYDPFTDRLTRIEYPGGRFFTFAYDDAGRRARRADQDGHATAYLYDALGRLDRMTNELGQMIVDYDYDTAGRLSRKTLGNGVFTTYTYNQSGQVTQLVNSRADSSVLSSFSYTYDASGRRASMTTLAGTETYGYDPLGQLTSVTYPNSRVVNYAYDAAGNRTQVTDNGAPTAYSANPLNQYTSVGGTNYQFDPDGNLTNQFPTLNPALSTTFTYDSENRLIAVTTPTDTWTYTYDAFGNRIAATHNGQPTRYVVDPTGLGNVAAEYDGGGSLIARYEHGFGLLARTDAAGHPAFYTFSAIGHTSELTGPSGAVANAYAYDPFGLSLAKTQTIPNPFEFVGEFGVMNEGNGLEFMRARFYANAIGRFMNTDPVGINGGLNLYAYVANRPTRLIDPKGKGFSDAFGPAFRDIRQRTEGMNDIIDGIDGDPERIREGIDKVNDATEKLRHDSLLPLLSAPDLIADILSLRFIDIEDLEDLKDYLEDLHDLLEDLKELQDLIPLDPDPTHKEDDENSNVVRSRDPNDKLGPSGYGSAGYLPAGGVMAYQIRFENQPSATAPAQHVTVTDTLDPNLDLSTFELTEIAFANQVLAVPAGLNHYETRLAFTVTNQTLIPLGDGASALALPPTNAILVEVDAHLDVPTRLLTLTLTAIDPNTGWYPEDPLTGFLYPNDDTGRGDGSISYLVRPASNLPSGTRIDNRASIVFDYNDPIDTPLVFNRLDSDPPASSVAPLPAESSDRILVNWSGTDLGAGIVSYDVYVTSDGGANWTLWLSQTPDTSATLTGTVGDTYAFYSVARDGVGLVEAAPATPDAMTTVTVSSCTGVEGDVAPRGEVNGVVTVSDWVQVGRFVAALDVPNGECEWLCADCAPRLEEAELVGGNGLLTVADWVQAGRYAAALDPATPATGPTGRAQGLLSAPPASSSSSRMGRAAPSEAVRVTGSAASNATGVVLRVIADASQSFAGAGFSVAYDPTVLRYSQTRLLDADQAAFLVNAGEAGNGRLGVVLALPAGREFSEGRRSLLEIEFALTERTIPGAETRIAFADSPIRREVVGAVAEVRAASWEDVELNLFENAATPGAVPWLTGRLNLSVGAEGVVTISWPIELVGGALETSPSLGPGASWMPVTNQPTMTDGGNAVRIEAGTSTRFYRLRKPQ